MDVLELVKLALVARLLMVGTQALGSTVAVAAAVNSPGLQDTAKKETENLPCFDWKGEKIDDGTQFIPEELDPCMRCTCLKGKREMCAAVRCSPPACPMWEQLSGECCQFHCINLPQEPGMNNKNSTTFIREPPGNAPPSNANDDTTNLGLRLVASTVTSFLILALLLFMIHRLRRRRMLLMMRRLSSNNRRENGSDVVAAAYVSEYDDINIGVEIPPYEDPPPPYSPPRPPRNLPMEAPPPYDTMPRASPGDVSEVGFRNVQSQTQDTMMRTSASQVRILDHGNSLNDNAQLGQVDNNNVHGAHDMNQNPIADFNQNRITNINTTNGATLRSQLVRLPETGMNLEFERLRRTSAPRSHRDEHNYENVDILRGLPVQEPMYANVETMRQSLIPDDIDHDRSHHGGERHSCYIDRERGRVLYERTRGRGSSSDTESNHSRRGGYETLDNPMSTDSSRASSTHQSFSFPNPRSADVSPNPVAGDGIEDDREVARRRPGDPRTSFLKKSGEMEVRRLRDSPRNSFCLDDNIDLDEVDLRPMNTSISSTPVDTRSDHHSHSDSLDRGHRRPCYQSGSRSSKIVLEDSEDRKIVCYSQDGAPLVSDQSVQTQSDPLVPEDHHRLTVPINVPTPKLDTPIQTCAPPRFRISKFLDAPPSNLRHSTYAAQPPLSNQNDTPGMHRRSLPPMSLSLGLAETQPSYQPEPYPGDKHHNNAMQKHDEPEHDYNFQNKLSRLKPDKPFSPNVSPDVYPGATHFSSPLTPVQSSSCNSPHHYGRSETPTRSPITPGTPLHPLQRSSSLLSQASFMSVCSETGEQRKRKRPSRHHGSLSPAGSRHSQLACSRGNPRKYPSLGSVLPRPLSCHCDEESVENFHNCRLHNSDRRKTESSYSVHSCPEELPWEDSLPMGEQAYGGARPKVLRNQRDNRPGQHGRTESSPKSPDNLNRRLSQSPDDIVDNAMDDNGNPALPDKRFNEDSVKPSDSPDRYRKVRKRDILVDPSTKFKQYGFIDSPELFSAKDPPSASFGVEFIRDLSKQTKSKSTGSVAAKSSDHDGHGQSVEHAESDPKDSHERSHSAERAPIRWVPGVNRRPASMAEPGRPGAISGFSCRRTRRNSYRRRSARRKSRQSVSFDQPDPQAHNRDSNNPISNRRSRSLERKGTPGSKREDSPATMVIRPGRDLARHPGNNQDAAGDSVV